MAIAAVGRAELDRCLQLSADQRPGLSRDARALLKAPARRNTVNDGLHLIVGADAIPAAELSEMLDALDKAFKAYVRQNSTSRLKAELSVAAVRNGSIDVLLDVIELAGSVVAARQYLAPFATHLAQLVDLALNGGLFDLLMPISQVDRKAINSLVDPVAKGSATQVNLVNNGQIVINVGSPEAAEAIIAALKASVPQRPAQAFTEEISIPKKRLAGLGRGELMGTAFLVDGTWYARLLGLGGVLVPISADGDLRSGLVHGTAYQFLGRPSTGHRGETVGIHVQGVTQVGGG